MENNMLDKEYKNLVIQVKNDVINTRYNITENANIELIKLYFRIGKIVSKYSTYGNKFSKEFSISLKLEFLFSL